MVKSEKVLRTMAIFLRGENVLYGEIIYRRTAHYATSFRMFTEILPRGHDMLAKGLSLYDIG